jgi:hypothetical protein
MFVRKGKVLKIQQTNIALISFAVFVCLGGCRKLMLSQVVCCFCSLDLWLVIDRHPNN